MDNTEEGGDDVRSSCLLRLGLHTCYNGRYKELQSRKAQPISKKRSQFGLWAATRPHEVGLYTPPVKPWELGVLEVGHANLQRKRPPKVKPMTGVKS